MGGSHEIGDLGVGRNSDQQKYEGAQYVVQSDERHRRYSGVLVFQVRFSIHDPMRAPQGRAPLIVTLETLEHYRVNVVLNSAKSLRYLIDQRNVKRDGATRRWGVVFTYV
jgi:hypothetical protein